MTLAFFESKAQAPSAAPTLSNTSGSFQISTARRTLAGVTSASPIAANGGFPCDVTPQAYGDTDAIVEHLVYASQDGVTWRLQGSRADNGPITITSFDANGEIVTLTDTQSSGVGALDFGTFISSAPSSRFLYIQNDSPDILDFLEFTVFDPITNQIANEFSGSVQFEVLGYLENVSGMGTLNVTQNGSVLWRQLSEGSTVIDASIPANRFIKLRISLVNYPVGGFTDDIISLAVNITTSNSLRVIPSFAGWKQGTASFEPSRGYGWPIVDIANDNIRVNPTAVNIGGLAAVNTRAFEFEGLADGTYRVFVDTRGVFRAQLTSASLPLGAIEIATASVASGVASGVVHSLGLRGDFGAIEASSAIERGRFVGFDANGQLQHTDDGPAGVSLASTAIGELASYTYAGYALVEAGEAILAGDEIGPDIDGKAVAGSLTTALSDSAVGEYVLIQLTGTGGGGGGGANTDESVKVSANDTTAGNLESKLTAGTNVTLTTLNDGANETLEISVSTPPGSGDMLKSTYDSDDDGVVDVAASVEGVSTAGPSKYYGTDAGDSEGFHSLPANTDESVKVSANDTTAGNLESKLTAGTNVTLTTLNDGANETLEISADVGERGIKPTVVSARYWAINILAGGNNTITGTREIEFRDGSGINLTGSGTASGPAGVNGSTLIDFAFDGVDSTRYAFDYSANPFPQRVSYDFGSDMSVETVAVKPYSSLDTQTNRSFEDYDIQYSDDGVTWSTLKEVRGVTFAVATEIQEDNIQVNLGVTSVSLSDSTPGSLQSKLTAGNAISLSLENVGSNENLKISFKSPLVVSAQRIAAQSITAPAGTYSDIVFDDEILDTLGIYNPANGRITPTESGTYKITVGCRPSSPKIGRHALEIYNATDVTTITLQEFYIYSNVSQFPTMYITRYVELDSTKQYGARYIDVNNTGGSLLGTVNTYLEVEKMF